MICKECGKMVLPSDGHIVDGSFYCNDCTVTCEECGEVFLTEDTYETEDGNFVCEDCRSENYYYCDDCGKLVHSDNITWIKEVNYPVCDNCLRNYHKCECCGDYFTSSHGDDTYDENWVCYHCAEYYYSACSDCGNYVHYEDSEDIGDYTYCPNCAGNHSSSIYDYHCFNSFSKLETKEEPATEEYFGFELEVSGDRYYADEFSNIVEDVVLMNDSSIEDDGFEIVTQPMTRNYFYNVFKPQLEKGLTFLHNKGFTGHNKGGMHVHISAKSLSNAQLAQMSEILYGDENDRDIWLCLSQRKEENMNSWGSMTNKNYSFEDIKSSELEMPYISDDRYTALNRDTRTRTYEIRIFNSNTRIERVVKNMECVFALIDYTKQEENSPYKCNTLGFLNFIKQNPFSYPYLYAYYLERNIDEHYGIKFTELELEAA